MKPRALACVLLFALAAAAQKPAAKPEKKNVMAFANGGVVVSFTDQYSHAFGALNLLDGGTEMWSSEDKAKPPHEFVIELAQPYRLEAVTFDSTTVQEPSYPGISAKGVEIWVSQTSAKAGFRKVAAAELPKQAVHDVPLPAGTVARWVKLVVTGNHGNANYTELTEVRASGAPVGAATTPKITGNYKTNYGDLNLSNTGGRITGCYYDGSGVVNGASDGRNINFEWRQPGRRGTAVMVLSSAGALNGYWFENGARQGVWFGERLSDTPKSCARAASVKESLDASGRAVLYGVHFDSDSAQLRADSAPTLNDVAAALKAQPALKLRVEGHTDSTNTDAYNLDLSKRRAQAVVAWLVGKGIDAQRLTAEGFGKAKPVADNATAQGRALNRRVEVVAIQ